MAENKKSAKRAGELQHEISKLAKKDSTSLSFAIAALKQEDQETLKVLLVQLDQKSEAKEKNETQRKSDGREKERFLARLRAKIDSVEAERIKVKTNFAGCRDLLECSLDENTDEETLMYSLVKLSDFIADLDVLKTLAISKTAKIIQLLMDKYSIQEVENKTEFSQPYINKLVRFNKLVNEFPLLLFTGYSFETIMHYKKAIEGEIAGDDNFACKLRVQPTIHYEYEKTKSVKTKSKKNPEDDGGVIKNLEKQIASMDIDSEEELELLGQSKNTLINTRDIL